MLIYEHFYIKQSKDSYFSIVLSEYHPSSELGNISSEVRDHTICGPVIKVQNICVCIYFWGGFIYFQILYDQSIIIENWTEIKITEPHTRSY